MKQKKKKTKVGRPATGCNTVYIQVCVHEDFADEAKALVKAKYAEWKAKRGGSVPKVDEKSAESPKTPTAKPVEPVNKPKKTDTCMEAAKKIAAGMAAQRKQNITPYLASRQKTKSASKQ